MITAKAPTRIDLCGGTLDIWPLYLFQQPAITINAAVNLYAKAQVTPRTDGTIEIVSHDQNDKISVTAVDKIDPNGKLPLLARLVRFFEPEGLLLETQSTAPAGSGLGGSSSLAIAVCGALNEYTGKRFNREELIGIARDIEAQVLGIPTGLQDYYAAMYGNLSGWEFGINQTLRHSYPMTLNQLESRLILFYSGLPRNSGINNWQVFKNCIDRERNTVEQLTAIHQCALKLHDALMTADWNKASEAIKSEWEARKKLAPSITTDTIESIIDSGISWGAVAGRVCGAGGGGCLILLTQPGERTRIESLAKKNKFNVLEFALVEHGLEIS